MNSRSKAGAGFTIVETMIVLAVSGLMFVLAISAMSGKQQETEFRTSIDTLKSQLNEDLSNVASSNYLSIQNNTYCTAVYSGGSPVTQVGGSAPPATDDSCDIIGEVLAFGSQSATGTSYYAVYPVFGRTYVSGSNKLATTIYDAEPTLDGNISKTHIFPYSLSITPVSSGPSTDIYNGGVGSIGVFSFTNFANGSAYDVSGNLNSGSQHIESFAIPQSLFTIGSATPPAIGGITECTPGGISSVCIGGTPETVNPSAGLRFCVNSGSNDESAKFTIGGQDSPYTADYQIYNNQGCV